MTFSRFNDSRPILCASRFRLAFVDERTRLTTVDFTSLRTTSESGSPRSPSRGLLLFPLAVLLLAGCSSLPEPARRTGPWDLAALYRTPVAQWGSRTGLVQEVYYEGEPYHGKPTRVFAYVGRPAAGHRPFPAIVLVHGGGGKAFSQWAEHWAQRGYVALAMDTAGCGPDGPLPDGGPDQSDATKFRDFTEAQARDMWTYHAVAAVIRGHSLLASLPEVDPRRIGITGISWGGYLTCIVAGLDHRLKVAVPVYGCGFLGDDSFWKTRSLAQMTSEARGLWLRDFDPSPYLGGVNCPILFLNGSNDFAYPLDSYRASCRLVRPSLRHVCIVLNLRHGHIWTFDEVDAFVDSALRGGTPLPRLGPMQLNGDTITVAVGSSTALAQASLNYTLDTGDWQQRRWQTVPAQLRGRTITASLPKDRPAAWFVSATDTRGLRVSTEHEESGRPEYDLVVYGGTSAGVMAAVQAKRMGKSAIIVCPDKHLGGLSSGGLGFTDTGNKAVIGGLAREFYHRIWQHYQDDASWKWQARADYGNRGQGTPAIDGAQRTMWIFEPHAAEQVFEGFIKEYQIPVRRDEWLDRASGVRKEAGRIKSIRMLGGQEYAGRMFIDATYEGDLMAAAGVEYTVGREGQGAYGEKWAGVQTGVFHHRHNFSVLKQKISPYVVPEDPASGLLPRISPKPPGEYGQGDDRIQAYCYRLCLTDLPENRVPFPKPEGYDPRQYELLLRIFAAGWRETFDKFDPVPNRKTDVNNHGPMSTDNIGYSYDYPDASYKRRREILKEHESYQKGWFYFIANDPRVPADVQQAMRQWGLARDEFADNGNWPHQIYVREARRMKGRFVMTENELLKKQPTPESVGMGSYAIDSHNVQRYVAPDGHVENEGDVGVSTPGPYEIAYGALVPKKDQCANLLVPVCVSSSHIAFGSIRMEPVFMILGQSAATAAVLAIDGKLAVQDVPYSDLRQRLLADHQVLEFTGSAPRKSGGSSAKE